MKMLIGGTWQAAASGRTEDVTSPFDGTVTGTVPVAGPDDVRAALDRAEVGAVTWRRTPAHERMRILLRAAELADERAEQTAQIISAEAGKTITEARGEASRSGDLIRLAAFEGTQLYGDALPLDANRGTGLDKIGFTVHQPVGIVVAITPFNYPALLVMHKLAPALAAGNAVVLKPARTTPLTALALARCLTDAGLPDGVLSVLTGPGRGLGDALVTDLRVRKVSFTGSTATGEHIARIAGIKKLSLELGSSCPVVVLPDADIELAASAVAVGGYINAGQVCISVQRVITHPAVAADFLDALVPKVEAIRTGDPRSADTGMGTLITADEAERVEGSIRRAVDQGAKLLTGGERDGAIVSPAVVAGVDPRSPFSQEELFGPAVAVSSAEDWEDAIAQANGTPYGLGAGIFTSDVSGAVRAIREIDAGTVHINWTPLWRADLMPYGGLKASGIGKEGPRSAVAEMTDVKTVILHGPALVEALAKKGHPTMTSQTVRLTVAQAVVTYLSRQYSVADGQRRRLIPATLGIFGHGNVAGLGQALDQLSDAMPFIQGRNEQALVHAATAFAKHSRRHATLAVTSSIGPGALNMVTGAALATVNRLPVLLLPGDTYATRHQGPVLQQLQHPLEADVTVNDAFRPVCRFFDRITRPEQLLTALPAAMRVLTDPVDAGAVVLSLPQDIQAHAYDYPAGFFAERAWVIRRPQPDASEIDAVLAMLAAAERPLIIAGGGVIYSGATAELERLAGTVGLPVLETFAGKGAVQQQAWWQIGGIGLEGTPAANTLAREADLVLTVGARLTDFATASHSLFANPAVRFASVNVNPRDADRLGATGIVADARQALAALADGAASAGIRAPAAWRARAEQLTGEWAVARAAALDPDQPFDPAQVGGDVVTSTDAVLTQGQVIGVLQEQARPGDVVIAAAGGPPGDLLKVWDATGGRHCHLEFGFSCMGYEIPAALGVRLADAEPGTRVVSFLGDGTFLLAPTELVTAAQEGLAVTLVVPDNRGYQVIHRLQMLRSGREFGNEFRYRAAPLELAAGDASKAPRLEGDYLDLDLVQVAAGLGARACRATTAAELRESLSATRGHPGPVVIVVPVIPHADLPGAGVWWDVAPAEVSTLGVTAGLRAEYDSDIKEQRWFG